MVDSQKGPEFALALHFWNFCDPAVVAEQCSLWSSEYCELLSKLAFGESSVKFTLDADLVKKSVLDSRRSVGEEARHCVFKERLSPFYDGVEIACDFLISSNHDGVTAKVVFRELRSYEQMIALMSRTLSQFGARSLDELVGVLSANFECVQGLLVLQYEEVGDSEHAFLEERMHTFPGTEIADGYPFSKEATTLSMSVDSVPDWGIRICNSGTCQFVRIRRPFNEGRDTIANPEVITRLIPGICRALSSGHKAAIRSEAAAKACYRTTQEMLSAVSAISGLGNWIVSKDWPGSGGKLAVVKAFLKRVAQLVLEPIDPSELLRHEIELNSKLASVSEQRFAVTAQIDLHSFGLANGERLLSELKHEINSMDQDSMTISRLDISDAIVFSVKKSLSRTEMAVENGESALAFLGSHVQSLQLRYARRINIAIIVLMLVQIVLAVGSFVSS